MKKQFNLKFTEEVWRKLQDKANLTTDGNLTEYLIKAGLAYEHDTRVEKLRKI